MTIVQQATVDDLDPGDYVCLVSDSDGLTVVKKALPAVLAIYGRSYGMATQAASNGGAANIQTEGLVPVGIHGLSGGPSLVRIGSNGRGEKVSSFVAGDFPGGNLDDNDRLAIHPERATSSVAGVPSLSSSDTVTITGTSALSAAVATGLVGTVVSASGSNRAAAINAAIAAASAAWAIDGTQRTVRLLESLYSLETAIVMRSGVALVMSPTTVLRPTFSGAVDSVTNAAILCQGTVDTNILASTTFAVECYAGVYEVTLGAVAGTFAAGSWMVANGHNNTDHSLLADGTLVELTELLQAGSTYAGGTLITLASPPFQHHASGAGGGGGATPMTVKGCNPIRDFRIEGGRIKADGGSVAVGVLCQYATGFDILDLKVSGFSRTAIQIERGSRDFRIDKIRSLGECNGVLHLDSAMCGSFDNITCAPNGLRTHASGVVRAGILATQRCTSIDGWAEIRNMAQGGANSGGVDYKIAIIADNIRDDRAYATQPAGAMTGVAYQAGSRYDQNNRGELALNCKLSVRATNIHQSTDIDQASIDLYHLYGFTSDYLVAVNDGPGPQSTINGYHYRANGIRLEYVKGVMNHVLVRGMNWCVRHIGNPGHGDLRIESGWLVGTADLGAGAIGLDLSYAANDSGIQWGMLVIANIANPVLFDGNPADANWEANPDWTYFIEHLEINHVVNLDVIAAYNKSGVTLNDGDIVELDNVSAVPAGQRWVKVAAGPNPRCAVVVVGGANNKSILISMAFRDNTVNVAEAVKPGDWLEVNASRQAKKTADQNNPTVNCFARAKFATSGAGVVRVAA